MHPTCASPRDGSKNCPFVNGCFDVVLCLGAFEYAFNEDVALDGLLRAMDYRGALIITMLNQASPHLAWETMRGKMIHLMMRWFGIERWNQCGQRADAPERPSFKHGLYNENAFRTMLTTGGIKIPGRHSAAGQIVSHGSCPFH
jgi:hypothetical protein